LLDRHLIQIVLKYIVFKKSKNYNQQLYLQKKFFFIFADSKDDLFKL